MLLWSACGPQTVVCLPCQQVTVAVVEELEMQSMNVFLVGNNVLYANKKFKIVFIVSVLSIHCLATLDLQARLEQPFNCLIIQKHQDSTGYG